MATVPISGTNIKFLANIPFSNDKKNTRWFDNITEQTNYFLSKTVTHEMNNANFQRVNNNHIIRVNKPSDSMYTTNYIMFKNVNYSNKWFYAFVTEIEYINREVSHIHFEIDVFQTWLFNVNFKPSFVVREHCKLWNNDGSPVLNTLDEGLDYGKEYEIQEVKKFMPFPNILFLVIVSKSGLHYYNGESHVNEIMPSINGLPQPLCYYVHPFKLNGSMPNVKIGGTNYSVSDITDVMQSIYQQESAVNNVVSIYITDFFGLNIVYDQASDTLDFNQFNVEYVQISDNTNKNMNTLRVKQLLSYGTTDENMGSKYSGYRSVKESKLLMYPYTTIVLDDFKGNRVELKNEYINNSDIVINCKGSLGTANKTAYHISDYNVTGVNYQSVAVLENSVISKASNDLPIINDYLSAYLQGNRNSIETQKNSIMWNGVINGISSTIGMATSGVSSDLSKTQYGTQVNEMGVASSATNLIGGMGNTVLQLQAIESKKNDISNTPPTLVNMGGNTQFDFGYHISGCFIIKKQIKSEYITKLSDFFNMFGYKVNEVKTPNFHTRKYWNYIQTTSCIITGNINVTDINEIKSIFDNGITLWHTDDIGNYNLDNEVL